MAEFNIPNKKNYTVPAGATVWIAKYDTSDVLGDYAMVGNLAGDCELGVELEKLENMTNLYGVDTRDRNPVIGKKATFKVPINEAVGANLEYMLGSSGRTTSVAKNIKKFAKVTFAAGVAQVNGGNAIVSVDEILPNIYGDTYDEGASGDYTVTIGTGTITLTGSSNISNGDTCIVYYTVAETTTKYPILDSPNISGAIQFIAEKSNSNVLGNNMLIEFTNVDIMLDGSIPLPKKDWIKATLSCEALADATNPTGALGYWYTWQD